MGIKYTVKAPNGKTYEVEGPEGATQEQIFDFVKANYLDKEQAPSEKPPAPSTMDNILEGVGNVAAGTVRGAGSIGASIMAPFDYLARKVGIENSYIGRADRRQVMDDSLQGMGADPKSAMYQTGKLGGEIAGTAGMGGLLANGLRAVPVIANSSKLAPIISAIESSGMTATGSNGLKALAARSLGGATTGAVSAAVAGDDPTMGAAIGGALPTAIKVAGGAGSGLWSAIQPFTDHGQNAIRDKLLRTAAKYGPVNMKNALEIVPGSKPTLAEVTGNADIATMQRVASELRPQAFMERAQNNSAARNALFDEVAGDAGKLAFYSSSRDQAAKDLYGNAMKQGIDTQVASSPEMIKTMQDLLARPAMQDAIKTAKRLAANEGIELTGEGSLQGLHYTKKALGDQISEAVNKGKKDESRILMGVRDKLDETLQQLSPAYKEASATYAEMSKPVNQMEFLQKLRLTDNNGNITLNKVNNTLYNIEQARGKAGINPAKSLTDDQINTLRTIRDDLLRQSNLGLGRGAGSNTFQNIATNNILQSAMPGEIGKVLNSRISTPIAQIGQVLYNKPNAAIQDKLVEALLNPSVAENAFKPLAPNVHQQRLMQMVNKYAKVNPVLLQGND